MRIVTVSCVSVACVVMSSLPAVSETHWEIQAVDGTGHATHPKIGAAVNPSNYIELTGILLNNPEDMLDGTAGYSEDVWDIGGQWEIFIQGEGSDHAGTACWVGQNYGNMPWVGDPDVNNYSDSEWDAELARLNYDGGHQLRMGDRVRVTGYGLEYNGKSNINERHNKSTMMDFTVEWLGQTPGLPVAEVITLGDVKDDGDDDIFDQTRMTGGEYYQIRLVRINDVSFVDPGDWAAGAMMEITDGTRTLPCKLGVGGGFDGPCNLDSTFDVVGVFNQEGGWADGYEIWISQYDGGSGLLGVPEPTCLMMLLVGGWAVISRRRRS